jgi:hypothetical protein
MRTGSVWVGPFLHDAASDYDGALLATRKLFRAYWLCMNGEANMDVGVGEEGGMDIGAFLLQTLTCL